MWSHFGVARGAESREHGRDHLVITREENPSSGALSIPEARRLAPNLHVDQTLATDYQVTARDFGGHLELQKFSNRILMLTAGINFEENSFSRWSTLLDLSPIPFGVDVEERIGTSLFLAGDAVRIGPR